MTLVSCIRDGASCNPACAMGAGGEFSLFYTNCEKQTVVSFDIRVALYNVKAGGYKDFLSVGEDMLPVMFMVGRCLPRMLHHPCRCLMTPGPGSRMTPSVSRPGTVAPHWELEAPGQPSHELSAPAHARMQIVF